MSADADTACAHVAIGGRVQGVGYRMWCERAASGYGLSGWVRNRRSGDVEALFCGPPALVDEMIEACWRGPRGAKVTRVDRLDELPPATGPFRIAPTA
jgi:acylphosphatase